MAVSTPPGTLPIPLRLSASLILMVGSKYLLAQYQYITMSSSSTSTLSY